MEFLDAGAVALGGSPSDMFFSRRLGRGNGGMFWPCGWQRMLRWVTLVSVPISCSGGPAWWQHVYTRGGKVLGIPRCSARERFRAKALCFGTSSDNTYGCRVPLGGVAVALLPC